MIICVKTNEESLSGKKIPKEVYSIVYFRLQFWFRMSTVEDRTQLKGAEKVKGTRGVGSRHNYRANRKIV